MIETNGRPFIVRVTIPAIRTVMTVVVIVFEMATDTPHVHFIGKRIHAVTIITSQLGMAPEQHEVCITGVIEARVGPRSRVVTFLALLSVATLVGVIGSMAAEASFGRVLEDLGLVTVEAGGVRMIANKGIAR